MKKHSAFSLIEMSIVIAIVGILIAGVAQASKMVKKSMLSTARTLTKRSVVNEMSGLVMWYETTLENSFIKTEMVDGVQVSTWYDNNPQAVTKTNATQSTTANKPIYTDNIINGLPALKFGGTKNFTTTNVCGQNYTIFVIFRTGVTTVNNYLTGWTLLLADATGVQYDTMPMVVAGSTLLTANGGVTADSTLYAANSKVVTDNFPHLGEVARNMDIGTRNIWIDGANNANDTNGVQGKNLLANSSMFIGRSGSSDNTTYLGYIGEIIIFNRMLLTDERKAVEKYLANKWKINLS